MRFRNADGQAHLAFPAGAGRRTVAGRGPRQQHHRTGSPVQRAAGPAGWQHAPVAGPGRGERAGAARAPDRGAGRAAQGVRPGRQRFAGQRPGAPAEPDRQAGPAAR
ncbi:hypothetical protein G6F46_014661 [Rhizopus delemar]|nr:hypothetical protein G6F68_014041 [Rhizopus microsporus]KAG1316719.1 hypothetical protein G6F63_015952 [Rhizopus arrhizus]KAG1588967.1 hypothetical protein G6F46_014661 [Rhizopus delemar]